MSLKDILAASTPGPWVPMKWGDGTSPDGITNVGAPESKTHIASDLLETDAALVALAPDMAAALIEAEKAFAEVLRITDRDHVAWDAARAALATIRKVTA